MSTYLSICDFEWDRGIFLALPRDTMRAGFLLIRLAAVEAFAGIRANTKRVILGNCRFKQSFAA